MKEPSQQGTTGVLLDIDKRLDELENQKRALDGRLQKLEKPFWRNKAILGSGGVLFFAIIGYFASTFMTEPEIQRIIHSKLLLSDRALALTLKRGRDVENGPSPLNAEIDHQVRAHLKSDDDTKHYLVDIAANHGVLTYSGSRTYKKHRVTLGRMACLFVADSDLRDLIVSSNPDAQQMIGAIDETCTETSEASTGDFIGFTDFSPLVIPFHAKSGDKVEIAVRVRAYRPEGNQFLTVEDGHKLVEAALFPETPVEFTVAGNNMLRAEIEVPADQQRHNLGVYLNEIGEKNVDASLAEFGDASKEFIVTLFVTIKIMPDPTL